MVRTLSRCLAVVSLSCAFACGSSSGDDDAVDGGTSPIFDADPSAPDAEPGDNLGTLPDPVTQSGVAYIGQFGTNELTIVRTDGATPRAQGSFDVGDWVRDMDIDPHNDLLVVVHEAALTLRLYQLARPSSADNDAADPAFFAQISMPAEHLALAARFDPLRQRLYVVSTTPVPGGGGPVTEYRLYTYDISNPTSPQEIGSAQSFPTAYSIAIDYGRKILFAIDHVNDELYGYDIKGDTLISLGQPLDLLALFPEKPDNQTSFQARGVTVDMYRNRLYMARSQGVQSELMAFDYPDDVPRGSARYGDFASLSDLTVVADPFPTQQDPTTNPNLLDAYLPVVDQDSGDVFLVADAWAGTMPMAMVVPISANMQLATACEAYESFGCWYRYGGDTGSNMRTDTAACVDAAHNVFVGASKDSGDEANPGTLHFFQYGAALATSPWLPSGGSPLLTQSLPVAAVCH